MNLIFLYSVKTIQIFDLVRWPVNVNITFSPEAPTKTNKQHMSIAISTLDLTHSKTIFHEYLSGFMSHDEVKINIE